MTRMPSELKTVCRGFSKFAAPRYRHNPETKNVFYDLFKNRQKKSPLHLHSCERVFIKNVAYIKS